jgi:DNA polymerase III alpha subunit
MDDRQFLREKTFEGLKERGFENNQQYIDRLEYELKVIEELNFCPYFLVMWDIARFVKENNILASPGRGSSSGSLLCYCLRITSVDPIKYELYFERFLNRSRFSSPRIEVKQLSTKDFIKNILPSQNLKVPNLLSIPIDNKPKQVQDKAYEDWQELSLDEKKYILFLKSEVENGETFSCPKSNLLYYLGILTKNPMGDSERFVSGGGSPDIDYDCSDRDSIIKYLEEKYGLDRTVRVGSYNLLKTKGSIRDVGRVLEKDYRIIEELISLVPPPIAGQSKSFEDECEVEPKLLDPKYSEIIEPVKKLWGLVRSYGTHAGGIVISPTSINRIIPLYRDKENNPISQFDYRDLEKTGLLKFDILGLKTLEVIQSCLQHIKDKTIDLENLEDCDAAAYKIICQGDLDGIFQLGGSEGLKQTTVIFAPQKIQDLSFISALFRPGPLTKNKETGKSMVDIAIAVKKKEEKVSYLHPLLKPILEDTYGIIVYQEQNITIVRNLAGFSGAKADILRKAIGKKVQSLMISLKEEFINGCFSNKISKEVAESIWQAIEGSSKYSFNKSHSIAYGIVTYWTAFLKAHYPVEFYSALIAHEKDPDRVIQYSTSAKEHGIDILPPDINLSGVFHKPEGNSIRFGLSHIKGMPISIAKEIVKVRDN